MTKWRITVLISLGMMLAGCATVPGSDSSQPVTEHGKGAPANAPAAADLPTTVAAERSPALIALLAQARAQRAAGDSEQAAVSLERALRIDARIAELWLELARVRFDQGEFAAAREFAAKARRLAGVDDALAREAERLLRAAAAESS